MTEREPMSDNTPVSLNDAIAAARAGRRDDAARMLRQIVATEPHNADAWIWLGGTTPEPQEQRAALEQALTIQPHNPRAQQGLAWLRQHRPEVFAAPSRSAASSVESLSPRQTQSAGFASSSEAATRPLPSVYESGGTTQPRIYETPMQPESNPHAATTTAQPRIYDAPTHAMPTAQATPPPFAVPADQTDRMPAITAASACPAPLFRDTDRMVTVPPPATTSDEYSDYTEQRSTGANIARWLVLLVYLFSFGALATLAALVFVYPESFAPRLNAQLQQVGFQLVPADIEATRVGTGIVFSVIAVIDLMLIFGLLFRGRWAWGVNLFIASVALLGAIALTVLAFVVFPTITGSATLNNPAFQALGGLTLFTLLFFIVSLASRRAFVPRRVVQSYER